MEKLIGRLLPGDCVVLDDFEDGTRDIAVIDATFPIGDGAEYRVWLVGDKIPLRMGRYEMLEVL